VAVQWPGNNISDQLQLLKYSLTADKLDSFVPVFLDVMQNYVEHAEDFQGNEGVFGVVECMAVTTIFTAAASLQGKEVREKLDQGLADLYHTLDLSFIPINFYLPGLPLPVNRRRDEAHKKIAAIYTNIINRRRALGAESAREADDDMIWSLMRSTYKDGTRVPDHEIANLMIGLLMAGQHNAYSVGSWILFRLASRPDIQKALYQEQREALGTDLIISARRDLVSKLPLHKMVVRETLRLHDPIHTVMRAVKVPLTFTSTSRSYKIPTSHVLISAPGVTAQSAEYFPEPDKWEPRRWEAMTDFLERGEKRGAMSAFLPFGAGRHRCVGEEFAYLQLCTIIAYMVRNFVFRPMEGEGVPKTDYTAMLTRPVLPARLQWEKRSKE
jgi:cytochrome P450